MSKLLLEENAIYCVGICEQKNGVHAVCMWDKSQKNVEDWVNALKVKGENAVFVKLFGYQIDNFGKRGNQNG